MRLLVGGPKLHRLAVGRYLVVEFTQIAGDVGKVVVGLRITRLQFDHAVIGFNGLVEFFLLLQDVGEVVVGLRVMGIEFDRRAKRGTASSSRPILEYTLPRLQWYDGKVGMISMAWDIKPIATSELSL